MNSKELSREEFYETLFKQLTPYTTLSDRIICFDSGENSKRNQYVHETLRYLINQKGIPALVLCDSNVHKTKHFFHKLPESVRIQVHSNFRFKEYLRLAQHCRDLIETLYMCKENLQLIETFMVGLRVCTARLVEDLRKRMPNLVVILDRTPYTGVLYSKAIRKNFSTEDIKNLYTFRPSAHFFVESTKESMTPQLPIDLGQQVWNSYPLYDGLEGLNERINLLAKKVSEDNSSLVYLSEESEEQNLSSIKKAIDRVLEE